MAMSKDRIHFKWTMREANTTASRKAYREAFGNEAPCLNNNCDEVKIICRPSQFARFIILRDAYDGTNNIKSLGAKIVPCGDPSVVDVSCTPAS